MGSPAASISHRKREQAAGDLEGSFEFEWELVLNLVSLKEKTLETSLQIIDFDLSKASDDLRADLVAAWTPFLPDYLLRLASLKPKDFEQKSQGNKNK